MLHKNKANRRAFALAILLIAVALGCILWIFLHNTAALPYGQDNLFDTSTQEIVADIYQDGILLQSISLSNVEEPYRFSVTGENGAINEIEVLTGSIGIVSANCPDKLCVHQGHISTSLLPITCLPNRLVIQIRAEDKIAPDIITY